MQSIDAEFERIDMGVSVKEPVPLTPRGRSDGSYDPKGTATRAEGAAILHRFLEAAE